QVEHMAKDWQNAAYVTPCLHKYCYACILRWAEDKPQCPLCKGRIITIMHSRHSFNSLLMLLCNGAAARLTVCWAWRMA
uniref:RING-type E3 ubiquitin transferase n=1 Tax=Accipiter nisus TaxID=211598 RepID=A0A8B9RZW8_9AVES